MAYLGTTSGSTSANPPIHIAGSMTVIPNSPGVTGGRLWLYSSTHANSDAAAAAFFSDGSALGMKQGDVVIGVYAASGSSAANLWIAPVGLVTASSAAGLSTNFISSTMA